MEAALASVFEFLFKYRPVVFERGTLVLTTGWVVTVALAVALLIAAPALLDTLRLRAGIARRDRIVLAALRGGALLLLCVCLLRPALLLSAAAPQRNVLAVVIDDSRSMRIADVNGRARADVVREAFGTPDSDMMRALSERFLVRTFRFSGEATRAADVAGLQFDGARSRVEHALRSVRQELAGVPLAGIVLVTDGADNADSAAVGTGALVAGGSTVPVFAVGVGAERAAADIEVVRVEAPRTALRGGAMAVDVTVSQTGLAGRDAQLVVEDDGRIIATESIRLPADGRLHVSRVQVPVNDVGVRRIRARVVAQPGELLTENNARETLVRVTGAREKILYIEGEPRFEFKFARRAVADDEQLQLVALQRTAEHKYLRLGVSDSTELLTGFPTTREELFGYRAVVVGSLEAAHFTAEQQRLLVEFVSERGGSLLFLGGRRAFREGGYAGTALGDIMPLDLGEPREAAETDYLLALSVSPTPAGLGHAVTQVAATPAAAAERWRTLPQLTSVNRVSALKPGATTLLGGSSANGQQPVLAFHRYGAGLVAALPVQDVWLWQMHADVPLEDETHQRFWRQLLRWMVSDVPGRVAMTPARERLGQGEPLTVRAAVRAADWRGVNDARVTALVRAPSGAEREVPMTWTGERDGEYRAVFTPEENGVHQLRATVERSGELLEADAAFVRSDDGDEEWFDAGLRAPLLRRIAEESGGRYYTPATMQALPRDVVYTESGHTVLERKDLWDMPAVLLLLVGLLGGEWGYRRLRGLV